MKLCLETSLLAPEINRTQKVMDIEEAFGLPRNPSRRLIGQGVELMDHGITLVHGSSGSGKSTLLREAKARFEDAEELKFSFHSELSVVDHFDGDLGKVLWWLGNFGLGEANIFRSSPQVLSEGQKFRLALALTLYHRPRLLIVDEFLSVLDRSTAKVVAYQFQKICRKFGISAICGTAHSDLIQSLRPDRVVELSLEGKCHIQERKWRRNLPPPFRFAIRDANVEDYQSLACFHYAKVFDQIVDWDRLFVSGRKVQWKDRTIGISLFTRPYSSELEKLPTLRLINEQVLVVERTVVHPMFRGLGVSAMLEPRVSEKCRFVVSMSALGKYFPFRLKSGFEKVESPSQSGGFAEREMNLVHWYANLCGVRVSAAEAKILRRVFEYASDTRSKLVQFVPDFPMQAFVKNLRMIDTKRNLL